MDMNGMLQFGPRPLRRQSETFTPEADSTPAWPPADRADGHPDVLLHDEPEVNGLIDLEDSTFRPALLKRLLAAGDAQERRAHVLGTVHDLGFQWLGYGKLVQVGSRAVPLAFCLTYAEPVWAQRYFACGYHHIDPRLHKALQSGLPFVWTIDRLAEHAAAGVPQQQLQSFIAELQAMGARSGVIVLGSDGPRHERPFVSLMSRRRGTQWIDDALLGQVITLALCLNEFYGHYTAAPRWPDQKAADAALTSTQRDILGCLARGMADKMIAADLGLSLHNVDYHLRQLRRRFRVHNRLQLMQAVLRGRGH
jgi:DNA-binding CsgD family transcriptional regulator